MRRRPDGGRVGRVDGEPLDPVEALRRLGGVATTADLRALTTRRRLRTAVGSGAVERLGRGVLGLGDVEHRRREAARLAATVSHLSAARAHRWPVLHPPDDALWVTVPRGRKVDRRRADVPLVVVHADLADAEVRDGVTAPLRTVLDCARRLPFAEGLAVADSALRSGDVDADALVAAACEARGPGSSRVRRVARAARPGAANPFESALRALTLDHPGLRLEPQVPVETRAGVFHPDLVDVGRRVVVEAESWTWHGDHQAFTRDCVRHTALAVAGWLVLRFTWEHVVGSPAWVHAVLADVETGAVSPPRPPRRTEGSLSARGPA